MNEKNLALEGLRGTACAIVVIHHFCCAYYPLFIGLVEPTRENVRGTWKIANSPLRILWAGQFSVILFFTLSGNVLTRRYVQKIENKKNKHNKQSDVINLSHSIIKRYIRLLIPVFFSVSFCWFVNCLGSFKDRLKVANITQSLWFTESTGVELYGKSWSIIWVFIVSFFSIWTSTDNKGFNNVLWTINYEIKGSFLVFLLVSIVAPESGGIKNIWIAIVMLIVFNLSPFVINDEKIIMTAFVFGFFFSMKADQIIMHECKRIVQNRLSIVIDGNDSRQYIFIVLSKVWLLLVCCLVWDMACIPQMGESFYSTSWWSHHQHLVKKYVNANGFGNTNGCSTSYFYELIGSVLLFHAVEISPFLQAILSLPHMIYLGKISFSLYLLHLPLLYTCSTQLFLAFYEKYHIQYDYSVASTFLIMIPIWLLTAHIFWYAIDSHAIIWSSKVVDFIFPPLLQENDDDDIENINIKDSTSSITHTTIE